MATADDEKRKREEMEAALHVYRSSVKRVMDSQGVSEEEARRRVNIDHDFSRFGSKPAGKKAPPQQGTKEAFASAITEARRQQKKLDEEE